MLPIGAAAKFAMGGNARPKKDLGMIAMAYGNVYVASVAGLTASDPSSVALPVTTMRSTPR